MEINQSILTKVSSVYQDFAIGNLNPFYEYLSEDVIWNSHSHPSSPFYGMHYGIKSIEPFFNKMVNTIIQKVDVHTVLKKGDKAVVLIDILSNNKINGQDNEENWIHVLRFENGKVTQVDIYTKPILT